MKYSHKNLIGLIFSFTLMLAIFVSQAMADGEGINGNCITCGSGQFISQSQPILSVSQGISLVTPALLQIPTQALPLKQLPVVEVSKVNEIFPNPHVISFPDIPNQLVPNSSLPLFSQPSWKQFIPLTNQIRSEFLGPQNASGFLFTPDSLLPFGMPSRPGVYTGFPM